MIYGREALEKFREERARSEKAEVHDTTLLDQIPVDAPMEDATVTVWNGQRWVSWEKWVATAPLITENPCSQSTAACGANPGPAAGTPPRASEEQGQLW